MYLKIKKRRETLNPQPKQVKVNLLNMGVMDLNILTIYYMYGMEKQTGHPVSQIVGSSLGRVIAMN